MNENKPTHDHDRETGGGSEGERKPSNMTEMTRQIVDLEGYRVINKNRYRRVLWERRFMACAIGLALLSIIFFVICIATSSWAIIDIVHGVNHTIRFHLGIWGKSASA